MSRKDIHTTQTEPITTNIVEHTITYSLQTNNLLL